MRTVEHINPEGMHHSPAFSQAISVSSAARTVYIGGQNSVNEKGEVVGLGDLSAQTTQAVKNLVLALEGAGAGLENLVKTTVYLVAPQDLKPAYEAWAKAWGQRKNPPTVTMLMVAGLGHPDWLVEIEGVAVVAEK